MKGKDPAFLFYSTDFYEGTRTMLPEERACFIDLMIYQHQRGYIPDDIKRVLLYCNGIDEATLKATLEAKFKLTDKGWINERLQMVIEEREAYSEKQSINGIVGQFWKKAKAVLNKKDFDTLKDSLSGKSNNDILELIKDKEINKTTLEAMLKASLKHLEDRDRNRIKDIDLEEGGMGETKPTLTEIKSKKEAEFRAKVSEFKQYPADMLKSFCDYWTESGEKDKKLRYEKQDVFDISRRLVTWQKRDEQNRGTKLQPQKKGNLSLSEIQQVYNDLTNGNNGYIGD